MRYAIWLGWLAVLCLGWLGFASGAPARGPSPVVYGSPAAPGPFRHQQPAHRELPCTSCHAAAPASARASDNLLPQESSCQPCHADAISRQPGSHGDSKRCATCHPGATGGSTPYVPSRSLRQANLHFSHRAHAGRGITCESCHMGPERAELPSMAQCLDCHKTAGGKLCATCHLSDPAGKLIVRFGHTKLVPRGGLGMSHDPDWVTRHRWVAADNGHKCASCHRERECVACHDGTARPHGVHPNDFLQLHPQQSRREPASCQSCHSTQRFCAECHGRLGLHLRSAPDVRTPKRMHPPASRWIRGPVLHAEAARRSLNDCVSCHAEQDCVGCHGSRGVGGRGLSPHPAGFAGACARPLAANARACGRCHADLTRLASECK